MQAGYDIPCIVTQPDKAKGRGLALSHTPVKEFGLRHNFKIYQPPDVNAGGSIDFLSSFKADLFAVIAYGQMLSEKLLDAPGIMPINLHASLLPRYRGAAPISRAIINGEKQTGASIIKIIKKMDAGPLLAQREVRIEADDTAVTLGERLSAAGAELLISVIRDIASGNYHLNPQEEKKATFAFKLKKEDGLISWDSPAGDIVNLVRGCFEWPGAYTYYKGRSMKIFKARPDFSALATRGSASGEVLKVSRGAITVTTGRGNLLIEELQMEGRKTMSAGEFINGYKIRPGEIIGKK